MAVYPELTTAPFAFIGTNERSVLNRVVNQVRSHATHGTHIRHMAHMCQENTDLLPGKATLAQTGHGATTPRIAGQNKRSHSAMLSF